MTVMSNAPPMRFSEIDTSPVPCSVPGTSIVARSREIEMSGAPPPFWKVARTVAVSMVMMPISRPIPNWISMNIGLSRETLKPNTRRIWSSGETAATEPSGASIV